MGRPAGWMRAITGREAMRSPGAPSHRREVERQSWPTRDSLRLAIFDYLEVFYNRQRRHSSLEYLTPVDFERKEQTPPDPASVAKLVPVH